MVVRVLFCEEVLTVVRRLLNRNAPARLELLDVFNAVRDALSKEALLEADITMKKKRKKKRRITKTNAATGQMVTEEIEVDDEEAAAGPAVCEEAPPTPDPA